MEIQSMHPMAIAVGALGAACWLIIYGVWWLHCAKDSVFQKAHKSKRLLMKIPKTVGYREIRKVSQAAGSVGQTRITYATTEE